MRILVLGFIVRFPMAGMVANSVQYLNGLTRLGHEVSYLEIGRDWDCCFNPETGYSSKDPLYGMAFAKRLLEPYGLASRWAYYDMFDKAWLGPMSSHVTQTIKDAEMVINLCGSNDLQLGLEQVPLRLLIEQDPVFTQVKHLRDQAKRDNATLHNRFYTYACNWGVKGCSVPNDGIEWQPTVPPVVLADWPTCDDETAPWAGNYTTVMQWQSYPPAQWEGVDYHSKDVSFPDYFDLPLQTKAGLEIALKGGDGPTREKLSAAGWILRDPLPISMELPAFTRYLSQSRGEFALAKHGYVLSGSGWFSERSACYLASGRPVVVQDTGFSKWLPTDSAIGAFTSPNQALAQLDRIESDYTRYRNEARQIASEYFDSDRVLESLLESAISSQPVTTTDSHRDE